MVSQDGRFVVAFNGEIYNFPELRNEVEKKGRVLETTSDTEILLHLFELFGPDMVLKLRGMFAFAIWDDRERRLFLARDPYGIKPLYTANNGQSFRFASQVKALLAGGRVSDDLEPAGSVGFFLWGSVPEPFTLYREIRALPAGHTQIIEEAGAHEPKPYLSIAQIFEGAPQKLSRDEELNNFVRGSMLDSVRVHLLADVEVGIFLSAGVDSSALLGLMRDVGQSNIRAITLGFEEFRGTPEDEVPAAARVAEYYGAEHVVRTVKQEDFRSELPKILEGMDQPSIDGVNTWFVAKTAQEAGLKVALSGVGGDELFAGYPSFRDIPRWTKMMRISGRVPGIALAAQGLLRIIAARRQSPKILGFAKYGGTYPGAYLLRRGLYLPFELSTVLDPEVIQTGLRRLRPLCRLKESITPQPKDPSTIVATLESTNYMRNQLLRDADWAGMAHSVEIRTPLVDVRLAQALAGLTPSFLGGRGKSALAAAPERPLPEEIARRPKSGFGIPMERWAADTNGEALSSKGSASRTWARKIVASTLSEQFNPKKPIIAAAQTE